MAEYTILQVKRDSTLNWYASNPRLALGEPGVDMDLHRFKIGNGIDRWNELPYMDDDLYKLLDEQDQRTADKVQDLLNIIATNKLDADQKHNAVTSELRNTSRELTERMTAVETGQAAYQENLTERQQEFEEAVTGDFEDTKAEVQAGLDEFNQTRDSLTVRMDTIAGQTTEDTEILDARVDANDFTHPNLGENIRNIHSQLKEAVQTSAQTKAGHDEEIAGLKTADNTEKAERLAADETERAARVAADEAEKAERIAADEQHDAEIARLLDSTEKLFRHGEFLQEQIDTNAAAELATQEQLFREIERNRETEQGFTQALEQEETARQNANTALVEAVRAEAQKISALQEETSSKDTKLSESIAQEKQAREQMDSELISRNKELSAEIQQECQSRTAEDEELSGRISALSETVADEAEKLRQETAERTQSDDELKAWNEHADAHIVELGEFLQEQANANAEGILRTELLLSSELFRIREEFARVDSERASEHQARENAENELQQALETEQAERKNADDALGERIDRETERITQNELDIQANAEKIQANTENIESNVEQTRETLSARDDYLQEQTGELSGLVLEEILARREDTRRLRESLLSETADRLESEAVLCEEMARIDEAHNANEAEIYEKFNEGLQAARSSANAGIAHVQEQANETASEVIGLNLGLYAEQQARKHEDAELSARLAVEGVMRKDEDRALRRVIDAQVETLKAEDVEIREELRRESEDIRRETGERLEELSAIHSRREEFLQEQTDELSELAVNEMLQNREKFRAVQEDLQLEARERSKSDAQIRESIAELDETHRLNEAEIQKNVDDGLCSAREKISGAAEHLQEQTDEISSLVLEQELDSYELRQKLKQETAIRAEADTALNENVLELSVRLLDEKAERQDEYSRLQGHLDHEERLNAARHEHYTEQLNDTAALNLQQALDLKHETENRRSEIQKVTQSIDQEAQERVLSDEQIRSQMAESLEHEADLRIAADETGAKIRADNDAGLQEQVNELAALSIREALARYRENLQAKREKLQAEAQANTDKQHDDAINQEQTQKYNDQISDLVDAILRTLFVGYRAREKIKARIKGLEDALTEAGILNDNYIPATTDAEIEKMLEDIFAGNMSGDEIVPDNEDEAEFLQDLYSIFNP